MDPGEMGPRDQEVQPGDLAAVAGGTGSRGRMRSGDPGAAQEEAPLQDVDLLLVTRTEKIRGLGDAEDPHQEERIEEVVAASREGAAGTLVVTGTVEVTGIAVMVSAGVTTEETAMVETGVEHGEEEEAENETSETVIVMSAVEALPDVTTCAVDPGMMIAGTGDLPVMKGQTIGAAAPALMIVTCAVDPLVTKIDVDPVTDPVTDLVTDLVMDPVMDLLVSRDQPEIRMMAGQASRP